jgi:glycosyltransferase involved in cell wall biosynthesis
MPNVYAGWIAKNPNVRLVVSPRGMLSEWALNYHRWRKRAAWWLLGQRHLLARADAFHATAESEAEEIRALGYRQPVYVIPNGIEIPERPSPPPVSRSRRRLVFLSRIHPKKGVDLLLQAWQALHPQFRDWDLVIAGPDNDRHLEEMRRLAKELGLQRVSFPGPVYAQAKRDLFLSADLFVLPTRSENFGMVIAEALGHGTPVVTTKGAPWHELVTRRCGWWVDVGAVELAAALREAMVLSVQERRAMGERGRTWMSGFFSWSRQTDALEQCYRDLAAGFEHSKASVRT